MSIPVRTILAAVAIRLFAGASHLAAAERVKVVASFSILGDFVAQVGSNHVEVITLVGPDGDAHSFEPSPQTAQQVAGADLVVVNGLGFEGWMDRLVEASGFKGPVVVAAQGVATIPAEASGHERVSEVGHAHHEKSSDDHIDREHGTVDPHAWQSAENVRTYVANIAEALCKVRPSACPDFSANAAAYDRELAALHQEIAAAFSAIPPERRKVISSHNAFGYFAHAYGIKILAPQGVSTEAEASAADVAKLIEQTREEGVTALFVENISDPRLIEQIGRETGVAPGGSLYSDALSPPNGPAPSYVALMRHNAALLQSAMLGS